MQTEKGVITVDPKQEQYSDFYTEETAVLHELGHRVTSVLNSNLYDLVTAKSAGTSLGFLDNFFGRQYAGFKSLFKGEIATATVIDEGIAETFALYVFPHVCEISKESKNTNANRALSYFWFSRRQVENSLITFIESRYAIGCNFFSKVLSLTGKEGFIDYIKNLSGENIPLRADFYKSASYFERQFTGGLIKPVFLD